VSLALLFVPLLAHAQAPPNTGAGDLEKDWNFRIGIFVPQSKTARAVIGSVGISGYLERTVFNSSSYEINIGVGFNGMSNAYSVPVMGYIVGKAGNFRYGFGAGYSFNRKLDGTGSSDAVVGPLLGYRFTGEPYHLSLDLRYNFVSGTNNELDGYSLTIGARF
jgi:hypothetical protein